MNLPAEKLGVQTPLRRVVSILGVPVDDISLEEALDRMEAFVRIGQHTGRTFQVATVNTDFIVNAVKDPETRMILQEVDLAPADGMPVVWAARLLGVPLQGRVAGADFIPLLAERAALCGFSIFFLGAMPGIAAQAAEILQHRYPGLKVAGVLSPPFAPVLEMDCGLLAEIKAANPDILLVAFGNPKQEKWIAMHRRTLGVPLSIGVGGTLDFITGNTRRAPRWMQRTGLEWLHRLLHDPRRLFRRYVDDFWIFGRFLARQWWHMRPGRAPGLVLPISEPVLVADWGVISVTGRLAVNNLPEFSSQVASLLESTSRLAVDLSGVEFLDSAAIGTLIHLDKEVRQKGGELVLVGTPESILVTLRLLRLEEYFLLVEHLEALHPAKSDLPPAPAQPNRSLPARETIQLGPQTWELVHAPRRFDAETAGAVQDLCTDCLAHNPFLLLNLKQTVFLASAGLAVLSQVQRLAATKNGQLIVLGCGQEVLKVLQLVNFDRFLTLYPDLPAIPLPQVA